MGLLPHVVDTVIYVFMGSTSFCAETADSCTSLACFLRRNLINITPRKDMMTIAAIGTQEAVIIVVLLDESSYFAFGVLL